MAVAAQHGGSMHHTTLKILAAAAAALALMPASAMAQVKLDPGTGPGTQFKRPPLPPPGPPTVVSLGDSAISGEAGRWAGNTKLLTGPADALGPTAYFDNASATGELIPGCHRARSAQVHIGDGVRSVNLACSGAKTFSYTEQPSGRVKPGIDSQTIGGVKGQALMLQEFAAANPRSIKAVSVLIGAGNYEWSQIAKACGEKWLLTTALRPVIPFFEDVCQDDPQVAAKISLANTTVHTRLIADAYRRVHQAMRDAGYADAEYRIIAQTYSSPVPARGSEFRYPEFSPRRQLLGGCPILDKDAAWVNGGVVTAINSSIRNAVQEVRREFSNIDVLEAQDAFVGRRLCENTVGLLEERLIPSWQHPAAADRTEWVKQINQLDSGHPDFQENAHPNFWGYMALRNCFRQAYNDGAPRGGTCERGDGLNARGEPNMNLRTL
jgi:hypothetical protein